MPRAQNLRRALLAVAAASVAAAFVANFIVLREGGARVREPAQVPDADVVLVLGAGLRPDGSPSDMLTDRLETALDLYRAGRAPRILVSGDHARPSYDEPGAMRAWLEDRGVPDAAIVMDHAGFDTYSSMWRARTVFGVEHVVVVTQAFHLPRALFLAGRLGLDATGVVADRRAYRGIAWSEVRETASRPKAWIDATTARRPRFGRAPEDPTVSAPAGISPPR
jgi:vancomycin permeability regulator SanA